MPIMGGGKGRTDDMAKTLTRETFETSREAEYFTEKELRAQIGHGPECWPVAIVRELIDNSLDACETARILPEISITAADDRITVADNGPGIPPEVLSKSMNYLLRVSDKAYYISPTRGQMGNALKTVWAAPFVTSGTSVVEVETHGEKHIIEVRLDRIAGKPEITHERMLFVKNSSSVTIAWPNSSTLLLDEPSDSYNRRSIPSLQDLIDGFICFNPHATFVLNGRKFERTNPGWQKWRPDMPTSAQWYNVETLRDLMAGYIAAERNGGRTKTVREFVSEFRGLSGTAKQKEVASEWSGAYLHDFVKDGDLDREFLKDLLDRMQAACTPPKPSVLGTIGEEHLTAWMTARGVSEASIKYIKKKNTDQLPYIMEVAFGINENDEAGRQMVIGLNWSPVIGGDPDPALRQAVQEARLDPHDPVTLVVHIVRPRFEFMDRGKTRLSL